MCVSSQLSRFDLSLLRSVASQELKSHSDSSSFRWDFTRKGEPVNVLPSQKRGKCSQMGGWECLRWFISLSGQTWKWKSIFRVRRLPSCALVNPMCSNTAVDSLWKSQHNERCNWATIVSNFANTGVKHVHLRARFLFFFLFTWVWPSFQPLWLCYLLPWRSVDAVPYCGSGGGMESELLVWSLQGSEDCRHGTEDQGCPGSNLKQKVTW